MAGSSGLTLRGRLTVVFLASFLISGAILLAVVYLLVRQALMARLGDPQSGVPRPSAYLPGGGLRPLTATEIRAYTERFAETALQDLLFWSVIALVGLAAVSVVVGWLVSGQVLRPLRRIAATARRLSSENLGERIGLTGARDELTELAGAVDRMLDRLQTAFDSQRRFVANASHELRTPLAVQRAAIQVGLSEDGSAQLAQVREQLLDSNRRSERLIDGLMLLARSERGLERGRRPVRLDDIVCEVLDRCADASAQRRLTIRLDTRPLVVQGDSVLLSHLVTNVLDNAIKYNTDGGTVIVHVGSTALRVSNTGPTVPADHVAGLFEPFQRGTQRAATASGSGLGLSVVRSIAHAHGGRVDARPRPGGGLEIVVSFPGSSVSATPSAQPRGDQVSD